LFNRFYIYQVGIDLLYDTQTTGSTDGSAMGSPTLPRLERSPFYPNLNISAPNNTETGQRSYTLYHNAAWYGMVALATSLLFISALLAGLTLAICGLDSTWLHLRSVTGTAKERYAALVLLETRYLTA
jgi:hypothetical protein